VSLFVFDKQRHAIPRRVALAFPYASPPGNAKAPGPFFILFTASAPARSPCLRALLFDVNRLPPHSRTVP